LTVTLLGAGKAFGAITLRLSEVRPFTGRHIDLLQTFADQAVIAIENMRLFAEVQQRTRELTESLEYQTATSDVLNIISRSPNQLQPVFDTIVHTAHRLCQSDRAQFFRLEDGEYRLAAYQGTTNPEFQDYLIKHPISPKPGSGSTAGKAARERRTIHVPDSSADPEFATGDIHRTGRGRSVLAVPLLRDAVAIGIITVARDVVKPFTDRQINLIETFADQALIAIENTRLFEEVQARNRDLTALGEVGRAVGSTLDLKVVLKTIVERAVGLTSTDAGSIFYYRPQVGRFELGETSGLDDELVARFRKLDIAAGTTGLDEAIASRQPLQVPDVLKRPNNALRDAALE